jgi:hypothetical protein
VCLHGAKLFVSLQRLVKNWLCGGRKWNANISTATLSPRCYSSTSEPPLSFAQVPEQAEYFFSSNGVTQ